MITNHTSLSSVNKVLANHKYSWGILQLNKPNISPKQCVSMDFCTQLHYGNRVQLPQDFLTYTTIVCIQTFIECRLRNPLSSIRQVIINLNISSTSTQTVFRSFFSRDIRLFPNHETRRLKCIFEIMQILTKTKMLHMH